MYFSHSLQLPRHLRRNCYECRNIFPAFFETEMEIIGVSFWADIYVEA
jgi:hypothetical protein